MKVCDKIKDIRLKAGLNQNEFAARILIPQSHLSAIEAGKKNLTIKLMKTLKKEFNISFDWLMDDSKGSENPNEKSNPHKEQEQIRNITYSLWGHNYEILKEKKTQLTIDEELRMDSLKRALFAGGDLSFIDRIVSLKEKLEALNQYLNEYCFSPYVDFDIELCDIVIHKNKDAVQAVEELKNKLQPYIKPINEIDNRLYKSLLILKKYDPKKKL